jgi:hypothetical protein
MAEQIDGNVSCCRTDGYVIAYGAPPFRCNFLSQNAQKKLHCGERLARFPPSARQKPVLFNEYSLPPQARRRPAPGSVGPVDLFM